ncbi:MAG: nitroreductase [Spirochaetes bacterium]|nr:nitroreductase [Spirochaetota bacterium]
MDLFKAMSERKSTRAYLDKAVSRKDIEEIIRYAGMAPSAINMQPWEYVVTYGEEKDRLSQLLSKIQAERSVPCGPGTSKPLPDKFLKRSRDASRAMMPQIKNTGLAFNKFVEEGSCSFYGAPIAVVVAIDKVFPHLRYLDVGLSISYLLLAAHAKGLGTCPVGLITVYAEEIGFFLNIPQEKEILLGIALGYADENSPVNNFKTQREELSEILSWYE